VVAINIALWIFELTADAIISEQEGAGAVYLYSVRALISRSFTLLASDVGRRLEIKKTALPGMLSI
jgi:hypothetical protein